MPGLDGVVSLAHPDRGCLSRVLPGRRSERREPRPAVQPGGILSPTEGKMLSALAATAAEAAFPG
jgi:hypothetical protein